MKTNYLILTAILSILLAGFITYLIVDWNFKSFNNSTYSVKFKNKMAEQQNFQNELRRTGYYEKLILEGEERVNEFLENNRKELHDYHTQCFVDWYNDNKIMSSILFLIPIISFLIFNLSILNIKYSNNFKTLEMIKEALKNRYYSIISIVYLLILVLNLILAKDLMLAISELL